MAVPFRLNIDKHFVIIVSTTRSCVLKLMTFDDDDID